MLQAPEESFPRLSKVYKGRFPFRLACPSFIYPADYLPNIRLLGPYLDEIELLFLEGRRTEHLPGAQLIRDLQGLSQSLGLTYNVHLFTDLSVCAESDRERREAIESLARLLERVGPLEPSACVLHLSRQNGATRKWVAEKGEQLQIKQDFLLRGLQSLKRLQTMDVGSERLVLENLETYPVEWLEKILDTSALELCLDLGHLLLQGADLWEVYQRNRSRIRIMHLHGVDDRRDQFRDHVGLQRLKPEQLPAIKQILDVFQGVLCLEVFNFEDLLGSLTVLEELLA